MRDDETGAFWSATPLPAGGGGRTWCGTARATRVYEHARDGIASTLRLFVPPRRAGQDFRARAAEHVGAARGDSRSRSTSTGCSARTASRSRLHVVTEPRAGDRRRARAQRLPPGRSADRVAFLDLHRRATEPHASPAIAAEFIGRNGTLQSAGRRCDAQRAVRPRRRRARSVRRRAGRGRRSSRAKSGR